VNHLLLTVAVRMPQLTDDVRGVARRGCLDESENRTGKEKFVHGLYLLLVVCWKIV